MAFFRVATQSVTARKPPVLKEDSVPVYEVRGVRQPPAGMDATSGRWDRARTQWQLGDWDSLAVAEAETLQDDPHRAELAALAACAHLQKGNKTEARCLLAAASRWNCPPEFLARALVAGVENNLARYHEVCVHTEKSQRLLASSAGAFGGDGRLAAQMRLQLSNSKKGIAEHRDMPDQLLGAPGNREKHTDLPEEEYLTLEQAIEKAKNEPSPFKPGITSYAQNFEDVMLWRALGHIENGFYIDIGAQHPVVDSMSKAFYERGWRGIHVEPIPTYAKLLREDRPDEIVIEAAVSTIRGKVDFVELGGLSTGAKKLREIYLHERNDSKKISVEGITLDDVLANIHPNQEINWMKIDVEGMEIDVIKSWKISDARPWILVIESTFPNSQMESYNNWEKLLISKGYSFEYYDGLNRYYVSLKHKEIKKYIKTPPNIFDNFEIKRK